MRHGLFLAAMLLTGCVGAQSGYPSLAHRQVEDGNFDEPVRPARTLVPDPALDQRIATIGAALADATAAFDRALPAAERRAGAARGKAAGSDAWVDAHQALAALDDAQARIAPLASEVDTAASDRAAKLEPAYPSLDALAGRIAAEQDRERAAVDRLQAMLPPG